MVDRPDVLEQFRSAFQTLLRFPLLVAPPLVVGLLPFALVFFIGGGAALMGAAVGGLLGGGRGMAAGGLAGLAIGAVLFGLLLGFLWILSSSVVVVMAAEALAGREPGLGEALAAVMSRLGPVVGTSLLVTAIVTVGTVLFVLPGLVAAVCLVFALPAVLLDRAGPIDALGRSVRLVRTHPGPVLGLVIGALLVLVALAIASGIASLVPVLGALASLALYSAGLSYLTVVSVSLYRALAGA
jgi:hypothetical protein